MTNYNLIEEVVNKALKNLLLEHLSSRVWHFLPLSAMYSIVLNNNQIRLSKSDRDSDIGIFYNYDEETGREKKQTINNPQKGLSYNGKEISPYYLSLSRNPSTSSGYVRMRHIRTGGDWRNYLCRIEFDGDLLNRDFKGKPVNYFRDKYDKTDKILNKPDKETGEENFTVYSMTPGSNRLEPKQIHGVSKPLDDRFFNQKKRGRKPKNPVGYTDYNIIRRNQMSEFEDRLFSNKPEFDITKYVKRIDIFIQPILGKISTQNLSMVNFIISKFPNITHVYNNEQAFNLAPTNMGGNYPEFTQQFINRFGKIKSTTPKVSDSNLKKIGYALSPLVFIWMAMQKYNGNNYSNYNDFINGLINKIGLLKYFTREDWNNRKNILYNKINYDINDFINNQSSVYIISNNNKNNLENDIIGPFRYIRENIYNQYILFANMVKTQFNIEKIKSNNPSSGIYQALRVARNIMLSNNIKKVV